MKVCDLTQFYSPVSGGVKRYIEEKVRYLQRQAAGDEHILIVPGKASARLEGDGTRTYVVESPLVSRTSRYRILLNLSLVEQILESEKPDIIESSDPYQVAWKAVASGRGLGIPTVGFYHSHFPEAVIRSVAKFFGQMAVEISLEIAERYVRTLYNSFERTLVPSPPLADLLRSWRVENVVETELGVDLETFHPAEENRLRNELGIPHGVCLLEYVGRLAPEKNVRTLFEAFQQLTVRHPGRFHLLAVGDGTQRNEVKTLQSQTKAVSWLPYCEDSRELARIYRAADLFVHPGVLETFGLVTLEAQACGTPVVGIRGSYMDRLAFSPGLHWAPANSASVLAETILQVSDLDLQQAGLEASATVHARYGWDAVFGRIFSIYREVIASYKA